MISLAGIVTALLVAARLGAAIMFMPIFSTMGVPKEARIASVLTLTLVVAPISPASPEFPGLAALAFALLSEVTVGVLMGGAVNILFQAMAVGGELISLQIGLAMATFFDPMMKTTQSPIGTLANLCAGVVFLLSNLHLVLIQALAESFALLPPGNITAPLTGGAVWIPLVGEMLSLGVRMAGPVICLTFTVNVFVGFLMRLAPKMNVFFALGMIVTQMAGLIMVFLTLPILLDVHHEFVSEGVKWIRVITNVSGANGPAGLGGP